jgi:hypothetical protein
VTRYQLVKLVQWAGTLNSRKRLQKVVFMLQVAGCPMEAEYALDVIGPYSQDVRHRVDEMTQAGLLEEEFVNVDKTYSYRLGEETQKLLADFEKTREGHKQSRSLAPYRELGCLLLKTAVEILELAGTLAYFRRCSWNWNEPIEKTCRLKKLRPNSVAVHRAQLLARQLLAGSRGWSIPGENRCN